MSELDTLNGVTRERLLELWDLTDETKPIWKDYDYLYKTCNKSLYGKEVGHVNHIGTRVVSICGKNYNYEKVLNWIKHGKLVNNYWLLNSNNDLSDEEFSRLSHIYGGICRRVGNGKLYKDVTLHHSFNTFEKWLSWAKDQSGFLCVNVNGNNYHLDKDILGDESNKMYSAYNCVFVPNEINSLAQKCKTGLGKGVQFFPEKKNKYRAFISMFGKPRGLGYYSTAKEANMAYREARFDYIDELEVLYGDSVDERVWSNLMREIFL